MTGASQHVTKHTWKHVLDLEHFLETKAKCAYISALFGGINFFFFSGEKSFGNLSHTIKNIFSVPYSCQSFYLWVILFNQLKDKNPLGQLLKYGQSGWTKSNRIVCFDFPVKIFFSKFFFFAEFVLQTFLVEIPSDGKVSTSPTSDTLSAKHKVKLTWGRHVEALLLRQDKRGLKEGGKLQKIQSHGQVIWTFQKK